MSHRLARPLCCCPDGAGMWANKFCIEVLKEVAVLVPWVPSGAPSGQLVPLDISKDRQELISSPWAWMAPRWKLPLRTLQIISKFLTSSSWLFFCLQVFGAGACVGGGAVWLLGEKGEVNAQRGPEVLPTDHLCAGFLPQPLHMVSVVSISCSSENPPYGLNECPENCQTSVFFMD